MSSRPLFRPPAEAFSLIIRIADGCPWNRCTFCGMYKKVPYRPHSDAEIKSDIENAARTYPNAKRIFLADGDAMAFPFERLKNILEQLNEHFPRLARINLYANGQSIRNKSEAELNALRARKLNTLYMGLESGDEQILEEMNKRETAAEMVEAAHRAQAAGLKMSVMVLNGLGGQIQSREHALATAKILNQMQPRILSALRIIPIPGTGLHEAERNGIFKQTTEYQAIEELIIMIEQLDLEATVFRSNHSSNILPLEGRFPKDKQRLLTELDHLQNSGILDTCSPGLPPLSL